MTVASLPSMTGVSSARFAFIAALGILCFACSAKTDAEPTSGTSDSIETQLTVPVGAYAGCMTSVVGVRRNINAVSGGEGTVTLSVAGDDTLNAVVSFGQWLSGTVAFAATSSSTAGLGAGPLEIELFDATALVDPTAPAAPTGASKISVSVAAGTLVFAGDTLFISLYAHTDDTQFSVYSTCPVPTSLPSTTLVNIAPHRGDIPSGSYAACTTFSGSEMLGSGTSGGDLTLTIAKSNGSLTVTQSDGFPSVCSLAFDDVAGTTATLSDGQTCLISLPCGPPPSLGTSSAPTEATLTNMTGAIDIAGGALFINVVGDAPADACGSHVVSLICPPAP